MKKLHLNERIIRQQYFCRLNLDSRTVATFIQLSIVFLFIWVRRNQLTSRLLLNLDEAELMATAKRGAISFIPFKDFTTPTFGPMWPMLLGSFNRLGLPLTIPIAHLLAALISAIVCIVVFEGLARSLKRTTALLIIFPFMVHWSIGFENSDFQILATELFSVLFIALACLLGWNSKPSNKNFFLAFVFLSCSLWSKYFFAPIIVVLFVSLFLKMLSTTKYLKIVLVVALGGFLSIPALLTTVALLSKVPFWKINESIDFTLQYTKNGGLNSSAYRALLDQIAAGASTLNMIPTATFLIIVGLVLSTRPKIDSQNLFLKITPEMWTILSLIVTNIILLSRPNPIFQHYLYLLIATSIASVLIGAGNDHKRNQSTDQLGIFKPSLIFFLLVMTISCSPSLIRGTHADDRIDLSAIFSSKGASWQRISDSSGRDLSIYCRPGERVLVWGWASELYSYYDWTPASRYVNTMTHMTGNPFGVSPDQYQRNLFSELSIDPPKCIVDATGPGFLVNLPLEKSIAKQMPLLIDGTIYSYTEKSFLVDNKFQINVYVAQD